MQRSAVTNSDMHAAYMVRNAKKTKDNTIQLKLAQLKLTNL